MAGKTTAQLDAMSDADLDAMIASKQSSANADLDAMSDEDLDEAIRQASKKEIVEEMHPSFTAADRLLVKNLSNDPEQARAYLQEKHPDLEIATEPLGNRIIARGKGETKYRVLDPDTGFFSDPAEMLRDAGDIVGDVGTGVATTAATAAGGLLAAPSGPGALAAASAAGAGSGAALEGARQQIGKWLGVNKEVKGGDVALAAGAGAISPLLFGTGATATQAGLKASGQTLKALNPFAGAGTAIREGVEGAVDAAAARGVTAPISAAKAAVGGFLRGSSAEPALDAGGKTLLANQRGLVGRAYDGFRNKIATKVGAATSGVSDDSIKFVRENLDEIDALEGADLAGHGRRLRHGGEKTIAAEQKRIGKVIEDTVGSAGEVDIAAAKKVMRETIEAEKAKMADLRGTETYKTAIKALEKEYNDVFTVVSKVNGKKVRTEIPDTVSGWAARRIEKQLKTLSGIEKKLARGGLALPPAQAEAKIALQMGAGATSQTVAQALDAATGGAYSTAKGQYADLLQAKKALGKIIGKDDFADTTRKLANTTNKQSTEKLARLKKIDETAGTDFAHQAQVLAGVRDFGKKNAEAFGKSSGGVTSTLRGIPMAAAGGTLGYYVGANSGLGQGGAGVGLAAGGLLGALIGGPAALRRYMLLQRSAGRLGRSIDNMGIKAPTVPFSAWTAMQNEGTGQ